MPPKLGSVCKAVVPVGDESTPTPRTERCARGEPGTAAAPAAAAHGAPRPRPPHRPQWHPRDGTARCPLARPAGAGWLREAGLQPGPALARRRNRGRGVTDAADRGGAGRCLGWLPDDDRRHQHPRPPARGGGQPGGADPHLGRRRGGWGSNLQCVTERAGTPVVVALTAGQRHERLRAIPLLEQATARMWPAAGAGDEGARPSAWRTGRRARAINRLTRLRRIAARDDTLASSDLAMVTIAMILAWRPLCRQTLVVCHASTAGPGGTVWGGHRVRPYGGRCDPLDHSWQIIPDRP